MHAQHCTPPFPYLLCTLSTTSSPASFSFFLISQCSFILLLDRDRDIRHVIHAGLLIGRVSSLLSDARDLGAQFLLVLVGPTLRRGRGVQLGDPVRGAQEDVGQGVGALGDDLQILGLEAGRQQHVAQRVFLLPRRGPGTVQGRQVGPDGDLRGRDDFHAAAHLPGRDERRAAGLQRAEDVMRPGLRVRQEEDAEVGDGQVEVVVGKGEGRAVHDADVDVLPPAARRFLLHDLCDGRDEIGRVDHAWVAGRAALCLLLEMRRHETRAAGVVVHHRLCRNGRRDQVVQHVPPDIACREPYQAVVADRQLIEVARGVEVRGIGFGHFVFVLLNFLFFPRSRALALRRHFQTEYKTDRSLR